ncbi:MAG: NADH-quinone oxidoreductase subunit N [Candidatus Aminicenantales bacterium]|jgi:NADH-quinone oxidoreductase subunit N
MDQASVVSGLRSFVPELSLLGTSAVSLLIHLFFRKRGRRWAGLVSLAGFLAAAALLVLGPRSTGEIFSGSLSADGFALFFKLSFLLAGVLAVLLSFRFFDVEGSEPGEVYVLMPLAIAGMMAAVASVDLVSTYVAFELFAIPSYILAGIFKKDPRSGEAGIKYFFLGTLSSGIMLLGMALIFGLTGETGYAAISGSLAAGSRIALAGMILVFAGLFFKAAMVPFHMWAPDVYEGAPTPLVVFLSTAPKAAVFAIMVRLIAVVFNRYEVEWRLIFQVIAVLTMFWGNIAALLQKSVKRLMAYSSIAQAGYIAIGLAAWGEPARQAILFYVFVYVIMNAAAFGMILFIRKGDTFGESIDDFRGLARKSPLAAASLLVVLLSLTGIPPTAGFMGKYFLFAAAVEKGMVLLAAAGAVNSVISLFYYFRIGRAIFFEDAQAGPPLDRSLGPLLVVAAAALALLVLGIFPSLLGQPAALSGLGR